MEVLINKSGYLNYHAGDEVPVFPFRGEVILATDPGKTNMAVTIGTPDGVILTILQFRAGGYKNDNSEYCHDFKVFLSTYLRDCQVVVFGIEAAISKEGMNYHRSSMVLTEIRANLIDLSYQLTGKKAFEVNNWSWKYAMLPDGLRGQHEKGSAILLSNVYQAYGNADVTDSICIYRYVVQKEGTAFYSINPVDIEEPLAPYRIMITTPSAMAKNCRRCIYNQQLGLESNVAYAINRTTERVVFTVPASVLTLADIYKHLCSITSLPATETVEVYAERC